MIPRKFAKRFALIKQTYVPCVSIIQSFKTLLWICCDLRIIEQRLDVQMVITYGYMKQEYDIEVILIPCDFFGKFSFLSIVLLSNAKFQFPKSILKYFLFNPND